MALRLYDFGGVDKVAAVAGSNAVGLGDDGKLVYPNLVVIT
jgi:hypothetical protein